MKQVIRTIIAYYNGHEFIKEQVDSILNQEGIENFDNQVYIYDDGSKKESLDKLIEIYKDEPRVKVFNDGVNKGPFKRYVIEWFTALKDKVDYIFFADQDDVFTLNKYSEHIELHSVSNKSLAFTSDKTWDYLNNKFTNNYRKPSGHNMSFMTKNLESFKKIEISKLLSEIERDKIVKYHYHDSLLSILFVALNDFVADWDLKTSYHRVHNNSLTNSNKVQGVSWRIRADGYNYYFYGIKPFIKNVFGINISINMFNKKMFIGDKNATDKQAIAGWIKWKLDNFAMYLRCKGMRNFVATFSQWQKSTKDDRKKTKSEYKIFLIQLKHK